MTTCSNTTVRPSFMTTKLYRSEICPPIHEAVFEAWDTCSIPYMVNAFVNVPVAIIATFANLLVLLAMPHITSIRLPSKLLLCSLVVTDFCCGLFVEPQFVVFLFMKATNSRARAPCGFVKSLYVVGYTLSNASLFSLAAISLDRYAALFLQLKYQGTVTTTRVCVALALLWSLSVFCASTSIWNVVLWQVFAISCFIVILLIITVAYIKIYRRLHCQEPRTSNQIPRAAGRSLNTERYKKITSAMMLIYVCFLLCYLPYVGMIAFTAAIGYTAREHCIWKFACTLVLVNSCLNPFLYCFRVREFRTQIAKLLRAMLPGRSRQWTVTNGQR